VALDAHAGTGRLLYCSGRGLVLRGLEDPREAELVLLPSSAQDATCAAFSPSGEWIASGDAAGSVKVWGAKGEHLVKIQLQCLGGPVEDVRWDGEGRRVACSGRGRGAVAKCFAWDTGSNLGDFSGLGSDAPSLDFRPARPFRVAVGCEDASVSLYAGPPFKFSGKEKAHSNFVNCVRYAPGGRVFASVSSDKLGYLWDGETGALLEKLSGHAGGVYSASWSPCGTKLLTCSADKTARIWDVAEAGASEACTFTLGAGLEDMQLGCVWSGDHLVSCALSGSLNYLDPRSGGVRARVEGHTKAITALAQGPAPGTVVSSSYDGVVCEWDAAGRCSGRAALHGNSVPALTAAGDRLVSVGMDDKARWSSSPLGSAGSVQAEVDLGFQPLDVSACADTGLAVAVGSQSLSVLRDGEVVCMRQMPCKTGACAISTDGTEVAAGGDDGKIRIFALEGGALREEAALDKHRGAVTALAYSPDGTMLASGDANREAVVWARDTREVKMSRMVYHTSRITCLSWCPNSIELATGSLDSSIIVWNTTMAFTKRVALPGAHANGVTGICWESEDSFLSAGSDGCIRRWARES
jgi:WD40 repeat protein